VVLLGALVAVATGIAYNAGAALQKREAVEVRRGTKHLLRSLVKRKVWLAATTLSTVAWVGQVAALALAPVALVVPLLSTGSALLVVLGVRFLHERFRKPELAGVALVAVGAAAAGAAEAGSTSSHVPLRFGVQVLIAIGAALCALIIARRRSGTAYGAASGFGFAAVAIFSKEIGDGFAEKGFGAVPHLLTSPAPWLLLGVSIGALSLLQAGFQLGNAASVMAALAVPEAIGPLVAGFWLYHERYPHGVSAVILPAGLVCAIAGSALLARHGRTLGEPLDARAQTTPSGV
jgi:drug/metabolite transporter (DMT)-like permease